MVAYYNMEDQQWPITDMSKVSISKSFHILNEDLWGRNGTVTMAYMSKVLTKRGKTHFKVPQ